MGELNRGPAEQSEAKSNIAVAERGEQDGLQQFRLAANDDKSAGGGASAGAQDRLPPLSIESRKYGAALPDTLPPLRNCPSYEPGVFGAELVPECRIYPPIEDSKPAPEKDADMQQIKAEDQPGAAREINPIKQQIMDENQPGAAPKFDADRYRSMIDNQPGAAKVDPLKEQIMKDRQSGERAADDDGRYQGGRDNLSGNAEYDRAMRSAAGVIAGGKRW